MDMSKPYMKAGLYGAGVAAVLAVIGAIPVLNCLALPVQCIAFFALPLGVGYYATKLAGVRETGEAAKQGVFAGLVFGVLGGIIQFVIGVVSFLIWGAAMTGLESMNSSPEFGELATGGAMTMGAVIIAGVVGIFISIALGAAFGALGGVIQAAMDKSGDKASSAPTPAAPAEEKKEEKPETGK